MNGAFFADMREDDGLDMTQKEAYLPDEEFQQVRSLPENNFHETWHLLVLFTCAIISSIWCILIVCSANIMRVILATVPRHCKASVTLLGSYKTW